MKPAEGSLPVSETFQSEDDYIRKMEAQNDIKFDKTNDVTYEYTSETFTKTSRLPLACQWPDGSPFLWCRSWNHERITNEAKALELVSMKTNIPVPQLLDHGTYPDGRRFLKTKFIKGPRLDTISRRSCLMPDGKKHTSSIPCKDCLDKAYRNAVQFISSTMLPQLASMKSQYRGIDGFVMPPSWLSPDVQPPWKGKKRWKTLPLEMPEYVFQHGDIAARNIIMDPQTLQVKALIDWEYAGFFPPGMESLPKELCPDACNTKITLAHRIEQFLFQEYVECYDKCDDKKRLQELIELGELPSPHQRQAE